MKSYGAVALFPAFIAFAIAMLILSPSWLRWASIQDLQSTSVVARKHIAAAKLPVWVNTQSGFYYCKGSTLFGTMQPGKRMKQNEALQSGYRPWSAQFCRQQPE